MKKGRGLPNAYISMSFSFSMLRSLREYSIPIKNLLSASKNSRLENSHLIRQNSFTKKLLQIIFPNHPISLRLHISILETTRSI